jgi:hypothetical protein
MRGFGSELRSRQIVAIKLFHVIRTPFAFGKRHGELDKSWPRALKWESIDFFRVPFLMMIAGIRISTSSRRNGNPPYSL